MLRYIILVLLITLSFVSGHVLFTGAYGEYHSALIGGEMQSGAGLRVGELVDISAGVWTYQSQQGWQSWSGQVRLDTRLSTCSMFRAIALGGFYGDFVDLSSRNPSPSLSGLDRTSRYRPDFAAGIGLDSLKFICRRCNYYFSSEFLVGDFVPFRYAFKNAGTEGETLSTAFTISAEVATPFGVASVYREAKLRSWFNDDIWRVEYKSPYCCKGLLRCSAGWETGYWGFVSTEINIQAVEKNYPFSFLFGVRFPEEISLWQWNIAFQFHPFIPGRRTRCNRGGYSRGNSKDVQILAPHLEDPYK